MLVKTVMHNATEGYDVVVDGCIVSLATLYHAFGSCYLLEASPIMWLGMGVFLEALHRINGGYATSLYAVLYGWQLCIVSYYESVLKQVRGRNTLT